MERYRIAIIRSHYSPLVIKSYNIQEIGLALGLAKQNISTDIYSRFIGVNKTTEYYIENGCKVRLIPISGISLLGKVTLFPGLRRRIVKEGYTVVQVHEDSQLTTPLILNACKKSGIKTVLYQGMYEDFKGINWIYQKLFDAIFKNTIIHNSDYIFAKTTMAQKYLINKGYSNVCHLHIGLNYLRHYEPYSGIEAINKFIGNYNRILLYVGKIEKRRNPLFIVDLCNHLSKYGKYNIGFIIVGDGELSERMRNYVKLLKIEERFLFISNIPNNEISSVYQASNLFILPSTFEIYGMVVLEALYFGTQVISTKTAGPLDILSNNDLGCCIEMDITRWSDEIIKRLEKEPNKADFRMYIENLYNWDNIAKQYIKLCKISYMQ